MADAKSDEKPEKKPDIKADAKAEAKTDAKPALEGKALWRAVDDYLVGRLGGDDAELKEVRAASRKAKLPTVEVTPLQARLLGMLVQISGAKRVLEIGTMAGYSAIAMANVLPKGGTVTTLEVNAKSAEVARKNIEHAGLQDRIEVMTGKAAEILPTLEGPFDLVFIDCDKPNNAKYVRQCLPLSKEGTLIVVDNVVRRGAVIDEDSSDSYVRGVRHLLDVVKKEPRLSGTAVQTVGGNGHDGFLLVRVSD